MKRALILAARGQGRVEPNPMVGCVIVRHNKIISEGYHRKFGGPHAEVNALKAAGSRAKDSTAYVTLEPCCHYGKTPPCTEALIAAGIKRVIAAMRDPFVEVRNRGLRRLRSAGIDVAVDLCKAEAARLNGPYLKRQRTGQPWVVLKWAQSLDGSIATRRGDSKWISNEKSRQYAHKIRGRMDAIIVGAGTVLADDPMLNCRHGRSKRIAARIILDPELQTPTRSKLIQTANEIPTIIIADKRQKQAPKFRRYERAGVEVIGIRQRSTGLDLKQLLKQLGKRGMTNIMVEGGGKTLGAFYDAGLADEAVVFVSHRFIGGQQAFSPLNGKGPATMNEVITPVETKVTRCGNDEIYHLRFRDSLNDAL